MHYYLLTQTVWENNTDARRLGEDVNMEGIMGCGEALVSRSNCYTEYETIP